MRRALLISFLCGLITGCSFIVHDVLGFPGEDGGGLERLSFSHRKHLPRLLSQDRKPWEKDDDGEARACKTCHVSIEEGRGYLLPNHEECRSCHSQVDQAAGCRFCHGVDKPNPDAYQKPLGTGELIFDHQSHTSGEINQNCVDCHEKARSSDRSADINIPSMWDCRDCHGGKDARENASWECQTCHQVYREGDVPPPQLALRPEDPVAHDRSFIGTHARAARRPGAACDRCHEDTSCESCHSVEKPRDHNLRFTKNLHGREATIDRERCTACHESGFCIGCHAIGPQTHFDNGFRLEGGHALQARRALRSCLACHQFVGFCDTPGCHVVTEDRNVDPIIIR